MKPRLALALIPVLVASSCVPHVAKKLNTKALGRAVANRLSDKPELVAFDKAAIDERSARGPKDGDSAQLVFTGHVAAGVVRKSSVGKADKFVIELNGAPAESFELTSSVPPKLVSAGPYRFDPPAPLLSFPLKDGEKLAWEGAVTLKTPRKGRGETTVKAYGWRAHATEGEPPYETLPAIASEFQFKFDSGTKSGSEGKIAVWFAKDRGLVRLDVAKTLLWEAIPE